MVPESRLIVTPILTGPTASGKTAAALDLAERHGLEIINADSLLVYRQMAIGTAKPSTDELNRVRHHLVDIRNPDQPYTAAEFVRDVELALENIHSRGRRALIVGGTPFYLKALLFGIWDAPPGNPEFRAGLENRTTAELFEKLRAEDPPHAAKIGPADRYRLIRSLEILALSGRRPSELEAESGLRQADRRFPLWIIDRPTAELESRIRLRTDQMLDQGLLEEARLLNEKFPGCRPLSSVGYAQSLDHLAGRQPQGRLLRPGIDGLRDEISLATRQLAKSQRTFLKGLASRAPAEGFIFETDRPRLEALANAVYTTTGNP